MERRECDDVNLYRGDKTKPTPNERVNLEEQMGYFIIAAYRRLLRVAVHDKEFVNKRTR